MLALIDITTGFILVGIHYTILTLQDAFPPVWDSLVGSSTFMNDSIVAIMILVPSRILIIIGD